MKLTSDRYCTPFRESTNSLAKVKWGPSQACCGCADKFHLNSFWHLGLFNSGVFYGILLRTYQTAHYHQGVLAKLLLTENAHYSDNYVISTGGRTSSGVYIVVQVKSSQRWEMMWQHCLSFSTSPNHCPANWLSVFIWTLTLYLDNFMYYLVKMHLAMRLLLGGRLAHPYGHRGHNIDLH